MLNKAKLIESIIELNPTASIDWLDQFSDDALRRYLDHLQHAHEPRGNASFWIRDAETAAVVTRQRSAA